MQIIDFCSGIGGFSVAGHKLGWETILFCEKEPFPQQVLRERFPGVPIFDDLFTLTKEDINGLIQPNRPVIVTFGFPCQGFSVAGLRKGSEDPRFIWPEGFKLIQAVRPDYIIGENVPGLLSIEGGVVFEQVCLDLESEGYEVQAFVLPACATGAPHRRDRVWIVAYSTSNGNSGGCSETGGEKRESKQGGLLKSTGADSGATSDTEKINANRITGIKDRERENNTEIRKRLWDEFGGYGENGATSNANESRLRREGNSEQQSTWVTGNQWNDWPSISPFHSGHDGLSPELVRHIRTNLAEAGETPENIEAYIRKEANWLRKQAIMAAGNAVVPTVVLQIMKAIQYHYENTNH